MKTTTPQHRENKTHHEFFTLLIALRGIGMPLNLPKPYQLEFPKTTRALRSGWRAVPFYLPSNYINVNMSDRHQQSKTCHPPKFLTY